MDFMNEHILAFIKERGIALFQAFADCTAVEIDLDDSVVVATGKVGKGCFASNSAINSCVLIPVPDRSDVVLRGMTISLSVPPKRQK